MLYPGYAHTASQRSILVELLLPSLLGADRTSPVFGQRTTISGEISAAVLHSICCCRYLWTGKHLISGVLFGEGASPQGSRYVCCRCGHLGASQDAADGVLHGLNDHASQSSVDITRSYKEATFSNDLGHLPAIIHPSRFHAITKTTNETIFISTTLLRSSLLHRKRQEESTDQ